MNYKKIKPTPSDFGNYVYCGLKWALDKIFMKQNLGK
jgi:hypothetical protein